VSREVAKRQFDYAWSLYEKGLRGKDLENKTKQFARDEHLPKVFVPAMHCIAVYVRDNPSVDREYALKGMLLAAEFSPTNIGLQHHVIRNCAFKAGLVSSSESALHPSILNKAKELLKENLPVAPARIVSPEPQKPRSERGGAPKLTQGSKPGTSTPKTKDEKRTRLIRLLTNLTPEMKSKLKQEKAKQTELKKPDFIWHFILQSFSTMGNSRGYDGLIRNEENYKKVTFEALSKLAGKDRLELLNRVFSAASLRMPVQKAQWAALNYDLIVSMGGLAKVKQLALSQKGTTAKIRFMKQFNGIGDKYARNIWMDVYHPDFRNSIAVDERIKTVSKAMGYSFSTYEDHENFYLEIAKEAGLEGWEFDRLMYNFQSYFLGNL